MVHGEEVPIVHDHDAHYYHNRRAGHHDLEEVHHRHDLFDFEDPQSDSDYDDMDEETGIYHDEDPEFHPAQYVRHQFSEDQYYRSRERYFPEDSYHAAGEMKFEVESVEDLTKHALGHREKKHKKQKKQKKEKKAAAE